MKGIVFNLLEQVVRDEHGEDTWDALLEAAGVDGVYTALGNYPDEELGKIVGAACKALGAEPDDVVRWFGNKALPMFAARYPHFFEGHDDTLSFLLTLNEVIHPEVRKLYPGADVPDFDFEVPEEGVLHLGYQSKRGLCAFAEGLIEGAAAHYGEAVRLSQSACMKRGDPKCVIVSDLRGDG